ncbi:MAG: alpha/beta hydrolase [Parvibaculum sp.]|nr:alpha/beta hydrolase [Parvibaculum sp.]
MIKRIFQGVGLLVVLALVVMVVSIVRFDKTMEELAPKYAAAPSQFIELPDGAKAHVRDQGKKDGPVLVLVHGSNASLHTWEPWVAILGAKYRVVTLDMPGHGLTGGVPNDDYSRDGMVKFTHEVAEKLGLTSYAIGGNSMGGGVAAAYTQEYPKEVTALILVDAGGLPRVANPNEKVPLGFRMARWPVINKVLKYLAPRNIYAEGVRKVFVDQSKVTEEMIDRYYDMNLYQGNRRATGMRFAMEYDTKVADRLGEIRVPTLIMWGDKDGLIPVASAYEFQKRIEGAKVVVYPDVGHIPMEEVPEKSAADVDAFLAEALTAGAVGGAHEGETLPVEHEGEVKPMAVSPE